MAELLKDRFDQKLIAAIATALTEVYSDFDRRVFEEVSGLFPALELKDRVAAVAQAIRTQLPDDYVLALGLVVEASRRTLPDFGHWPYTTFVELYGLDHVTESLAAMEVLTQSWSCEFAIRPFLSDHLEQTMQSVREWAIHENEHVRRLASEGIRPLLPWAPKVRSLVEDPGRGIAILGLLRHDPSETVRRSVANHLNDVAKADPELVATTLASWSQEPGLDPRMVKHALRTMVKRGHPAALELLGFTVDAQVRIESFVVTPSSIELGESITLDAILASTSPNEQRLVIDFVIHHPTANGKISRKVFKWKDADLGPGRQLDLTKKRTIQTASTRRYTAGEHRIDLQVAGVAVASSAFILRNSSF